MIIALVKYHVYESAHALLDDHKIKKSVIPEVHHYTDIQEELPEGAVIDDVKTLNNKP